MIAWNPSLIFCLVSQNLKCILCGCELKYYMKLEKLKVSMALRCTGGVVVSGSGMQPNLHCTHTMTLEEGAYISVSALPGAIYLRWLIDGFGILPRWQVEFETETALQAGFSPFMASRAISFGFNKQHTTSTLISTPTTVTLFLQSCTAWVHAWRQAGEETSPAIPAMPQIQLHCLPRSGKSTGRSLALLSRGLASWATIPCMDGVNSLWQLAHLTDLTPSTCWTRGHDIISKTNRGILPFTLRLGSLVQICLTIALSGNDRIKPRSHFPLNLSDNRTVWLWSHETQVSFSAWFLKTSNVFCAGANWNIIWSLRSWKCPWRSGALVGLLFLVLACSPTCIALTLWPLKRGRKYLCQLCRGQYTSGGSLMGLVFCLGGKLNLKLKRPCKPVSRHSWPAVRSVLASINSILRVLSSQLQPRSHYFCKAVQLEFMHEDKPERKLAQPFQPCPKFSSIVFQDLESQQGEV